MTLQQAKLELRKRIETLERALIALDTLTSYEADGVSVKVTPGTPVKRVISDEARRKMAAAQKRRWQKYHALKAAKAGKRG